MTQAKTLNRGFAWPVKLTDLDPHRNSSDALYSLIAHYLAPLIGVNEKGELIPALATSWKVDNDGKRITLTLRENAKWSDGTPLTALQAKQSLERALSELAASDAQPLLLPITGVAERIHQKKYQTPLGLSNPTPLTLQIDLTMPSSTFLYVLAHPISSPVPVHKMKEDGAYPSIKNLASSGPYRLLFMTEKSVSFEHNPYFYDEKPFYDQVSFIFGEYIDVVPKFFSGQLQIVDWVDDSQIVWLKKNYAKSLYSIYTSGGLYLMFKDEARSKINKKVRHYLFDSIDVDRLKEVAGISNLKEMTSLVPWWDREIEKKEDMDFDKIREDMEKMGYTKENPLNICISGIENNFTETVFNYLRLRWQSIYIKLEMKGGVDYALFISDHREQPCDLTLSGYRSRTKNASEIIAQFFPGGLYGNYIHVSEDIIKLQSQLERISDIEEQEKLIRRIENKIITEKWVKPLNAVNFQSLAEKSVTGFPQATRNMLMPLSQFLKPAIP